MAREFVSDEYVHVLLCSIQTPIENRQGEKKQFAISITIHAFSSAIRQKPLLDSHTEFKIHDTS